MIMLKPARKIAGTLIAAILFCLAAAASAQANWFVEGTQLTGTQALATTAAVDESFKLKAAGVTITCTGKNFEGVSPQIEAPESATATSLVFKECASSEACTVTKTIGTVPVRASVTEGASPAVKAVFSPKTKTIFATIKYNGAECPLLGVQPVTGKATALLPTGEEDNVLQEVAPNIAEASGELKLGSSAAELKGAALLELASEGFFAQRPKSPVVLTKGEGNFGKVKKGTKLVVNFFDYEVVGAAAVEFRGVEIVSVKGAAFSEVASSNTCTGNQNPGFKCSVAVEFAPPGEAKYESFLFMKYKANGKFGSVGKRLVGEGTP